MLVRAQLLALHYNLPGFNLTAVGGKKRSPVTKNKTVAMTAAEKRKAVTGALAEQYAISPQTAAARRQAKSQAVVAMYVL